ncbi:MAG: hypothetical protein WB987_02335 [Candidatus Acidiferrales bacterium]
MIKKLLLGSAVLLVIAAGLYYRFHHANPPLEIAYAGNRQVTLKSTTAQVREDVATVGFGDRLEVLARFQDQVQVRTVTGLTGWVNQRDILTADIWQKAADLEKRVALMPVQARGHTKVLTNLRIDAGRDATRIRQLNKAVPLETYERRAVEVPTSLSSSAAAEESAEEPPVAKKEDWWLVRARTSDKDSISGWILGRFIELDVPQPLPDYASSAGMRIVGWFELNRVADLSGKSRPQYLLVGAHGPEGQPCDFSLLRVYTWGKQRGRYETAYVESGVCGKLPVSVTHPPASGGDATFAFENIGTGKPEVRTYGMHQTIVRRLTQAGEPKARKRGR